MKDRNCIKDNGHRHNALWTFSPTFFVEEFTQKFIIFSSFCLFLLLCVNCYITAVIFHGTVIFVLNSSESRQERVAQCWLVCLVKWFDCGGDDEKNIFFYIKCLVNLFLYLTGHDALKFAVFTLARRIFCLFVKARPFSLELTVKMKGNDHFVCLGVDLHIIDQNGVQCW